MNEPAREYFWGVTLDKENPTITWSFDEEEDDTDFLIHTLFLKQAVLGASAVKDERNLVQVETKNFDQKDLKHPLFSLTLGRNEMTTLDVSFGHEVPVVFRLVEGSGPVCLSAQQLVEFPDDKDVSQDESELECTEGESAEEEEALKQSTNKRKASSQKSSKSKDDDEDEMDDDDEEDESIDDEVEDEEMDSSPEKSDKKKGKKGKDVKKGDMKKGGKASKVSPKKDIASEKSIFHN